MAKTRVIIRFSQIWNAKIQPNFWFRLESFGHRCLQLHLDEVTMEGISKFHPKKYRPFCLWNQWKFKHTKLRTNTSLRHLKQQQLTFMAILRIVCIVRIVWNEIRHLIFWPKMGNSAHNVRLRLRPRATETPPLLLSLRPLFRLHWNWLGLVAMQNRAFVTWLSKLLNNNQRRHRRGARAQAR